MEYTKAYKLSTSGKADQVIYIGKHCKIENFFLFCEANASVSLYITEYLTTKGADGKRRTNTYYIFKDKLVHKSEQYNQFLSHYDHTTKSWTPASFYPGLEFKFPHEFRLHVVCGKSGGKIDVMCNLTDMDKYKK